MNDENRIAMDTVEKLLKYGGCREQVDKERSDRVEQTTFEHWQRTIEARRFQERRRRRSVIGTRFALAASVILAVVLLPKVFAPTPFAASVVATVGVVESGARGEPMTTTVADARINAGGFLETGVDAGASLSLARGHSLRVGELSRVRIEPDAVILDRGRIYIDSGLTGNSKPITVESVYGIVRELGTQYQVRLLQNGLEVGVREGQVNLELDNAVVTAAAGEILQLADGDNVIRGDISSHGAYWSWATQLAPAIAIDGLTVDEFLEWLSRENGWQFSYATASLQNDARMIRINGSIDGLESEDALASVLASVGWLYNLTDGIVVISSDDTVPAR
jgi:ferric-dicitrate binding protein FerR (iron transport regulator)